MKIIDTGVQCSVCKKGTIAAEVEWEADATLGPVPIGPGSQGYYNPVIKSFSCQNNDCALVFHHPPGKPEAAAEILSKESEERSEL